MADQKFHPLNGSARCGCPASRPCRSCGEPSDPHKARHVVEQHFCRLCAAGVLGYTRGVEQGVRMAAAHAAGQPPVEAAPTVELGAIDAGPDADTGLHGQLVGSANVSRTGPASIVADLDGLKWPNNPALLPIVELLGVRC